MKKLGSWGKDKKGLPIFSYTGNLPFKEVDKVGKPVKLPQDPWFILGNYQLTLFTHVSGEYELIAGQRSWGRVNAGIRPDSGQNRAAIRIDGDEWELCGIHSAAADANRCERKFGCGHAVYRYCLGDVEVKRTLAVKPSLTIDGGKSAFLTTIEIRNHGNQEKNIEYLEGITANYVELQYQNTNEKKIKIRYIPETDEKTACAKVRIQGIAEDPLLCTEPYMRSCVDGFPPTLYIKAVTPGLKVGVNAREITATEECRLAPGEQKTMSLITGYLYEYTGETVQMAVEELCEGYVDEAPFSEDWKKILPDLSEEEDTERRQEMRWHAYVLEAMATYSHYYKETKIPQGTIYDYDWGQHASARDNFQHALPLVYYNQKLAKSVMRYMMKRTTSFGEIRLIEYGNGHADNNSYYTSDQQLFFFLLLSEYLRVTKDYCFLEEMVAFFPGNGSGEGSVLDHVQNCFLFLRDIVNVGTHGLVRLLNSDWNDTLYYIIKAPYNRVYFGGESHMNSAMVLSIFQVLIPQLEEAAGKIGKSEQIARLVKSMTLYRTKIMKAFLRDMEGREFPRRMYFEGQAYGEENMFLEPMGYTLQIQELSAEYKRNLYQKMRERLYKDEKLGARQQQNPEFEDEEYDKGSRENGGFWWALNGPVIVGVGGFDRKEAQRLLSDMSFTHYQEVFPQYWTSYWSAADNIESALIPEEGLPDQSQDYSCQPVFCAHPHAWLLYCYYYLKEESD